MATRYDFENVVFTNPTLRNNLRKRRGGQYCGPYRRSLSMLSKVSALDNGTFPLCIIWGHVAMIFDRRNIAAAFLQQNESSQNYSTPKGNKLMLPKWFCLHDSLHWQIRPHYSQKRYQIRATLHFSSAAWRKVHFVSTKRLEICAEKNRIINIRHKTSGIERNGAKSCHNFQGSHQLL